MSGPILSTRKGRCLCGAVQFEADLTKLEFGACHCEMCRRWTGSALLGITVPTGNIRWQGEEHIATRQTSPWAMRAWCRECGSNLYFRVTADSQWSGDTELPIGLLDDASGLTMTNEIYIDHKPDSYAYTGDGRTLLTRQDCVERFNQLASE